MPDTDKPEREPIMHRARPSQESFAHFYLTKVALGEGCGCAEHAIRLREIEGRAAGRIRETQAPGMRPRLAALFARLAARFDAARLGKT
jgi:hypothetical protein